MVDFQEQEKAAQTQPVPIGFVAMGASLVFPLGIPHKAKAGIFGRGCANEDPADAGNGPQGAFPVLESGDVCIYKFARRIWA